MTQKCLVMSVYIVLCIVAHNVIERAHYNYCRKNIWLSLTLDKTSPCALLRSAVAIVDTSCVAVCGQLVWAFGRPTLRLMKWAGIDIYRHVRKHSSGRSSKSSGSHSTSSPDNRTPDDTSSSNSLRFWLTRPRSSCDHSAVKSKHTLESSASSEDNQITVPPPDVS